MKRSFWALCNFMENKKENWIGQKVTNHPKKAEKIALISKEIDTLWNKNHKVMKKLDWWGDLKQISDSVEVVNKLFDLIEEIDSM